ncbi:MAG: phytoene desaturase family protein [Candidatus Methylomirabilales bacterium]
MNREIECLILGSGIGSLTCGTTLAQRGWRVLLLCNRLPEETFSWSQDGFHHDRSPELYWGLEEDGFLRRFLGSHGIGPEAVRLQPGVQVVLPRHRLDFYGFGPDWERELRREFPRSWRSILTCWKRLSDLHRAIWRQTEADVRGIRSWVPPRIIGRRRLRGFLLRFGLELPFCHMVEAVSAACFHVEPWQTTVAMATQAFGHTQRGFFALRDGAKGLAEQLTSRFQGLGGEIRLGWVREIRTRWGKVDGVRTADGEEVDCRYLVLEPELTPGNRILHLLVDEILIPGEMRQNVLVVETDPLETGPMALLQLALGSVGNTDDPLRQKQSVAVRVLQAPREDPMTLLERAFPGWARAKVYSAPTLGEPTESLLPSRRWRRPRNLLVISHENPVGRGLSAAALSGHQLAVRLLSRP